MIPKECKRLAEVDFSIAVVSRYSALDLPAGRQGSPSATGIPALYTSGGRGGPWWQSYFDEALRCSIVIRGVRHG